MAGMGRARLMSRPPSPRSTARDARRLSSVRRLCPSWSLPIVRYCPPHRSHVPSILPGTLFPPLLPFRPVATRATLYHALPMGHRRGVSAFSVHGSCGTAAASPSPHHPGLWSARSHPRFWAFMSPECGLEAVRRSLVFQGPVAGLSRHWGGGWGTRRCALVSDPRLAIIPLLLLIWIEKAFVCIFDCSTCNACDCKDDEVKWVQGVSTRDFWVRVHRALLVSVSGNLLH